MIYILFLLLGIAPTVCAMEAENTPKFSTEETSSKAQGRKPLQRLDPNVPIRASIPTCLNLGSWGYTLTETLEMRRSCLTRFESTYVSEINFLGDAGLFDGRLLKENKTVYNKDVMQTLHGIFTTDTCGGGSIPSDFKYNTVSFFEDLDAFKKLIKERESQTAEIKALLEEIQIPFHFALWMTTYYWNHKAEYLQKIREEASK